MVAVASYFDLNQRAAAALGSSAAGLHFPEGGGILPRTPKVSEGGTSIPVDLGTIGGSVSPAAEVPPSPVKIRPDVISGDVFSRPVQKVLPLSHEPPWHPMSVWDQIIMYFGVVLGVVFSSAVQQFKPGSDVNLKETVTLSTLLVAALVALVIIPLVFQKLSIRPDAPFIVRFGLFVQNGVFWQVIVSSIGKTFA